MQCTACRQRTRLPQQQLQAEQLQRMSVTLCRHLLSSWTTCCLRMTMPRLWTQPRMCCP